jgi:aryl-alcohol dehydrogenase-like predicted oxidoreductase
MQSQKLATLDDYRLLGNSGLRISPLCLGTMTFGTDWGWGSDKEESRKIFDLYVEKGGNFIDTANIYTSGTSETFVGEFLKPRREEFVLATKYTASMRQGDPNAGGNHRKNMIQSVEASLKRLETDYIDLYWLHVWEYRTPIEEVMRALDDLVRSGKIVYLGISDTPAWKVSQANAIAELRGWTSFIALQIEYSLIERAPERDLIPMGRELNIGVLPWSPLGSGILTGKYSLENSQANGKQVEASQPVIDATGTTYTLRQDFNQQWGRLTEKNLLIAEEVKKIANEVQHSPAQVALNWLLQQPGVVSPILGARTVKQLEDNLGSLDFILSPEQVARLDSVSKIDYGFPHTFLASKQLQEFVTGGAKVTSLSQ